MDKEPTYEEISSHPKWDEIHDLLKEEGYSTGSEEAYDKLYDELHKRIKEIIKSERASQESEDVEAVQEKMWRDVQLIIMGHYHAANYPEQAVNELKKKYNLFKTTK